MKEPPVLENMSVESSMQTEIRNGDLKTDNKESIDKNVDENAHNGPIHNDCTLKIHEKTVLLSPNTEESIKTGIDNLAFESDTLMANGKSENHKEHNDFNLNQSSIDQKLKDDSDYKTTEEIAEAVNLELLNMGANLTNGLNGIPVKNPNSTVINMSSPYDEYFIPVNEHRKYIRGEKLYVTKNKRDLENSKKNCCVWIAGLVTAMVAICLAILIATKFNQDPLSANERRSQDGNILNAGIGYGSSDPVSNFQNSRTTSSTADFTSEYLKQALEGEFTIDNLTFTPGLADHDSKEFKEVATSVEEELKEALFDHSILTYGSANIYIRVINLTPENVVQYRIGWVFKPGIQNPPDPINVNSLKDKLKEYIRKKQGFLYNYRVPVSKIYSKNMINDCLINNGNCSDSCTFDYEKMLDFFCTCPENFKLDKTQYNCEPITDFTTEIKPELRPESEPTSELEPKSESSATSQREPKSEGESTFEPELSSAQPKSEPESNLQLEPSTELEPKSQSEPSLEAEPKSEPEPKSELESLAEPESKFESKSTLEPKPLIEAKPEYQPKQLAELESKSTPKSSVESESKSEPEPSVESEPKSEPESSAVSESKSESELKSKSESSVVPELNSEPEPSVESEPKSEPEPSAVSEPEPSAVSEPKSEPELKSKLESSVVPESNSESEPSVKSEPESSAVSEPKSEPELKSKLESSVVPESNSESEPSVKSELEPSAVSEPEPSTVSEPKSKPEPEPESKSKSKPEPESSSEPEVKSELKSSEKSQSELSAEPVPTFQAEPSTKLVPKSEEETTIQTKTKLESELKFLLEPGAKSVSEFTSQSESKSELELTTMIPSSKLESSLETNNDSHASKNVNIIPEYTATTPENTKHSLEIINKANNSKENISMLTNLVLGRNLNGITMKPNVMMNDISIISPENIEDSVIEQVTKATSDQINIDGFSLNTTKKLQNVSNDSALINSVSNAKLDSISAEVTTVSDIRKQPDEEEKVEGKISTDETILDDLVENTSIPVTKNIKDGVEINLGSAKTDVLNVSAKINETETEESNLKNSNDLNAVENINYGTKVNLNVTDLNVKLNTEANTENIPTSTYDKVSINISDIEKENLSPTDAKVEDINNNIPLTGEVTKSKVSIDVNSELAADAKNVENDNFEQNNSKISEEPKKKISLEINNSSESTESSSLPNEISLDDEKTGNNITLNDQLQKISDSNPHLQPVFDVRLIKNDSNNCDNNTDNKLCNFTNAPVPLIKLNSSLNMDNSLTGNIGLSPKSMFFQFDPAEKTVKLENSDDNANQRINTSKRESLKSDKQEQNAVVTDKKQSSGKELTDSERKSSPLKGEQKKIESRRSIKNRLSLFDFLSALQKTLNTSAH